MANDTPKEKRIRKPRRNWELELRSLKTYIETKLEVLRESDINDLIDAQIKALEGVLKRIAQ